MSLLFIIWDVNPQIFSWLPIPRWYGLFWAIGLFLSYQIMAHIYRKDGKPRKELDRLTPYLVIGTFIGARLGHILFYDLSYFLSHPIEILPIKLDPEFQFAGLAGLASHGGGMGILLAVYIFSKRRNENYFWLLDRIAIVAVLTGCFIRLGNLMNSEIIGTATSVPWAFIFVKVDPIPRHPAQLYEAIYCLMLFGLLFYLWKNRRKKLPSGFIFGLSLVILFSLRFIDEFFKINQEAFEAQLPFNMGQLLSIPFIIAGVIILINSAKGGRPLE